MSAKIANTMLAIVANVNKTCAMRHFTQTHFLSVWDLTARGQDSLRFALPRTGSPVGNILTHSYQKSKDYQTCSEFKVGLLGQKRGELLAGSPLSQGKVWRHLPGWK